MDQLLCIGQRHLFKPVQPACNNVERQIKQLMTHPSINQSHRLLLKVTNSLDTKRTEMWSALFPQHLGKCQISDELCSSTLRIFLPEVYVASGQPLQSGHIQDRELVPCQTEPLHASEFLQDGRDAAEAVEGQAEVGQSLQRAQLRRQRTQEVTVQEKSLQAGGEEDKQSGTNLTRSGVMFSSKF